MKRRLREYQWVPAPCDRCETKIEGRALRPVWALGRWWTVCPACEQALEQMEALGRLAP